MTTFNKFIICWSIIVVILNFTHSFGNVLYNTLIMKYSFLAPTSGYQCFSRIFAYVWVPMTDLLTSVTLLYLFYFTGRKEVGGRTTEIDSAKNRNGGDGSEMDTRKNYNTQSLKALLIRGTTTAPDA